MKKTIISSLVLFIVISWFWGKGEWSGTITGYTQSIATMFTQIMHRQNDHTPAINQTSSVIYSTDTGIYGITMGEVTDQVIKTLGSPDRKDKNSLGYEWWIYNKDLSHYLQVGVKDGIVKDLYSNAPTWNFRGLQVGTSKDTLRQILQYQESVQLYDPNGKVTIQNKKDEYELYLVNDVPVIFYFDKYNKYRVTAIRWISREYLAMGAFFNRTSSYSLHPVALEKPPLNSTDRLSVEEGVAKEIFDITNVYRLREGLRTLSWNQTASQIAKAHSQDMVEHQFFDHRSHTTGLDPFGGGWKYEEPCILKQG